MLEKGTHPLPFFWKCVKRKGFKSFVLKVCETKGFVDAFWGKCVKRKSLSGILASFEVSRFLIWSFRGPVTSLRATRGDILAASGDYKHGYSTTTGNKSQVLILAGLMGKGWGWTGRRL